MKNHQPHPTLCIALICILGLLACGEDQVQATSKSHLYFSVNNSGEDVQSSLSYKFDGETTRLTIDGVIFELNDPGVYRLNWELLGLTGVTTTHSGPVAPGNTLVEGARFSILGRSVEVEHGALTWGDHSMGQVAEGDVFIVDSEGLRASTR